MDNLDKIKIIIAGILIAPSLVCISCLFLSILQLSKYENFIYSVMDLFPSLSEMFFTQNTGGGIFIGFTGVSGAILLNSVKLNNK
jgi:hypothetical protein